MNELDEHLDNVDGVVYKNITMEDFLNNGGKGGSSSVYIKFKKLSMDEQIEAFSNMSSEDIYSLVKNSSDSWAVEGYDLITPDNAIVHFVDHLVIRG
ncbi:hypothetical protein [Anaerosporobacter sp.]